MDFKQLEAFINVANLKSFSKAAESIYLSQPTISSHINNLEKELNVKLFDRTSKKVELTPVGKSFLKYAINIVNTKNNALSYISCFNKTIKGELNILASTTPSNSIISNLILKFNDKYPNIHFNIREFSSEDIIRHILNFDYEIGFIGMYSKNPKLKNFKLFEDELVVVSNPTLNIPDVIDIQTLKKQNFIIRNPSSATWKVINNTFKQYSINIESLNVICEVNNLNMVMDLVKKGLGISIVSRKVVEKYYKNNFKISVIKNIPIKRNIYLIINSNRTLTPSAYAFLKLCSSEYNFDYKRP